jgi:hypothetical protein
LNVSGVDAYIRTLEVTAPWQKGKNNGLQGV